MTSKQSTGTDTVTAAERFAARLSLRHPAVQASAWTIGSYGTSQVLRLASNLILTRLLLPEAFGLMAIVNVILQGLQMISDFGIGPNIVQNRRGEDAEFLWTAWTVQIVRSFLVWGLALCLAWPLARFYGEPQLLHVLLIVAFATVIDGFTSTRVGALQRRLEIGRVVLVDLFSYVLCVATMILGALYSKTVWPLVAGALVYSSVSTVLTHLVLGGPRMRFALDSAITRELFRFGKWLFISSILTFLCGQTDRIVLAKVMSLGELGVYSIAFMLSQVVVQLVSHISRSVLFPLYARAAETGPHELRRQTIRFRSALLALALPPMWLLVVLGPEIIAFLYDDRYLAAGWMVQVLGAGAVAATVLVPVDSVLLASGDSFRHMVLQFIRSIVLILAMGLGGYGYGVPGVIFGYAASNLLYYPFLAAMVRKYRVWLPLLDAAGILISVLAIGLGLWLKT